MAGDGFKARKPRFEQLPSTQGLITRWRRAFNRFLLRSVGLPETQTEFQTHGAGALVGGSASWSATGTLSSY